MDALPSRRCLLPLLSQLCLWASPFSFFYPPTYISGLHLHHSPSSAFPSISLGFTILFLPLPFHLHLWASPFSFLYPPTYIYGLHHSLSSSTFSGLHHSLSSSAFPAVSLGFTILLLPLPSRLHLWASPFSFLCLPTYISGLHHSPSSSAFPPTSLGFTILLPLSSHLHLWASPFSFLYPPPPLHLHLWASPFSFLCLSTYIFGLHHSSSSAFPPTSLGFISLGQTLAYMTGFFSNHCAVTFRLCGYCMLGVFLWPAFARLGHECLDLFSP